MSKGNIHRKVNDPWYSTPELQRAKEREYHDSLTEEAAHKHRAVKSASPRSDHKHLYESVAVIVTDASGREIRLLGKVCSVCGKLHSKTEHKCTIAWFAKDPHDEIPPNLKQYRYLGQGKITEVQEDNT